MYLDYFGFSEFPFALTPNTSFFCNLKSYQEALNVITVSLRNGEGFIKVVGEVGTGKTLLCRKLLKILAEEKYTTAYITNPHLDVIGLYKAIATELGIKLTKKYDLHDFQVLLNKKLLAFYKKGTKVVVIVDEAQVLPNDVLEALRILSNLETESNKLLHIVLFGQPELDHRLAQNEFRQLRQRITFSYHLRPLLREELGDYLLHRLTAAGFNKRFIFTQKAEDLIYKASRGIPRLINVLCHKALLISFGLQKEKVEPYSVRVAIKDTESVGGIFKKLPFLPTLSAAIPFLLGCAILFYLSIRLLKL
jgi:MSHA biogenesis protein MshM